MNKLHLQNNDRPMWGNGLTTPLLGYGIHKSRGILFALLLTFSVSTMLGQSNEVQDQVAIGTVFQIGEPATPGYRYINFPKANFIIK